MIISAVDIKFLAIGPYDITTDVRKRDLSGERVAEDTTGLSMAFTRMEDVGIITHTMSLEAYLNSDKGRSHEALLKSLLGGNRDLYWAEGDLYSPGKPISKMYRAADGLSGSVNRTSPEKAFQKMMAEFSLSAPPDVRGILHNFVEAKDGNVEARDESVIASPQINARDWVFTSILLNHEGLGGSGAKVEVFLDSSSDSTTWVNSNVAIAGGSAGHDPNDEATRIKVKSINLVLGGSAHKYIAPRIELTKGTGAVTHPTVDLIVLMHSVGRDLDGLKYDTA